MSATAEIPEGFDFVIADPRAIAAIRKYEIAVVFAEEACAMDMVLACGLPPEQAMTAMTNRLIHRAAAMACSTAVAFLGRAPDPERWRRVTDDAFKEASVFVQMSAPVQPAEQPSESDDLRKP